MSNTQILVVEDEGIVAKAIQSELVSMGYDVPVIAASGREAVEKAEQSHPDLVLMDISLKGDMDGIEAAKQIRDHGDIPIVYLTAYEDETTLGRAKVTEPFGYLLKPYEERELHTTIEMALYKHRMEQRVKQTEQWLAATLQSIDDGVLATDARLGVRFMNPIAEALTGWDRESALGKDLKDVCSLIQEETHASLDNLAAQAARESIAAAMPEHALLLARDGRATPVDGSLSPICDDEGNFAGIVAVFRDISERKRMENIQRQAEEHLRHSQKMEAVSRLAGGVAHDFNNLLTAILGNTGLVLAGLPEADLNKEPLSKVETAALRAAELVEQLLSFSGQSSLFLKPTDLNALVQEMVIVLRRMIDPRIQIEFRPGPDLWTVQADPAQINELLINLCLNAQDAMPTGGRLLIETDNNVTDMDYLLTQPSSRPGDFVRLRISDTGQGIPPEIRPRIYDPFFTTKEPGKGTGLGLALVFGIVEQHKGWIDCFSKVNQGTRFDIHLPRYFHQPVPLSRDPQGSAPLRVAAKRVGTKTILLADDEALVRDLGQTILQRQGYDVLVAEDGVQAVEIFQRECSRIDLVILDLTMPRLCGDAAFRQMIEIDPTVRVLFSSGYFAEDLTAGDDRILGFISKPYRHEDLANMVRAALEK